MFNLIPTFYYWFSRSLLLLIAICKFLGILYIYFQDVVQWPTMERWLQQRYAKINPDSKHNEQFRTLGYQWRVLRFNGTTRQSAVKIMATYRKSDPASIYLMQQPHCLAVPCKSLDLVFGNFCIFWAPLEINLFTISKNFS